MVVVVNGCTDETAAVAFDAGARVIESAPGYGNALLSGYRYALGLPALPWVVQMDADGQHPAASVPQLVDALERADAVVGSRLARGGSAAGWPRRRLAVACSYSSGAGGTPTVDGIASLNHLP